MKKQLIKKIAMILALIILCTSVTACKHIKFSTSVSLPGMQTATEAPTETATEAPTETATEAPAEAPTEVPAEAPTEAPAEVPAETTAVTADNSELTGNWEDMQFILDGALYQLPLSYRTLENAGWTFDLADYGYENGYIMNPGDKVYSTIHLENPAYDDRLDMTVGFVNNSDAAVDIMDCDIWSLELNTCYGFKQVDSFPAMTIGNGLHFGSTHEEVLAAMGPCDDIYEATEYGYRVYSYNYDFSRYVKITVFDDIGITAFDLSTYE